MRVKPPPDLSPREREVLGLLGTGMKTGEIASLLGISPKTASVHLTHAKSKLDARTVFEVGFKARLKLESIELSPTLQAMGLTLCEFSIFEMLLAGAGFRQICSKVCLADTTVERHLSNLKKKCGAKTNFQLGWLAHQFLDN